MKKRTKRPRLPKWIWQLGPDILNSQEKHFLAYIWWCSSRGCRDWDYSLSARFGKCKRTIRRWIKHLRDMRLITVNFPGTKSRTLYKKPYFHRDTWLNHGGSAYLKYRRTLMSYIYNAKHKKEYTTTPSYAIAGKIKDFPARARKESAPPIPENETRSIINRPVSQGRPTGAKNDLLFSEKSGSISNPREKDIHDEKLEMIRAKKRLDKGLPILYDFNS